MLKQIECNAFDNIFASCQQPLIGGDGWLLIAGAAVLLLCLYGAYRTL